MNLWSTHWSGCTGCSNCNGYTGFTGCTGCNGCNGCTGFTGCCTGFNGCTGCTGWLLVNGNHMNLWSTHWTCCTACNVLHKQLVSRKEKGC